MKEGDHMASSMFFLGISLTVVCSFSLSMAFLLYVKSKKNIHLYISLLLANYLVELVELLYIARFCLPADTRYFNLIHFPVLRIFTTVSILLLDFLILLHIMSLKFHKSYLLLFAAVILFCGYTVWLPQTLLTVWLFYLPRQIYHFGYCVMFLLRRFLEKDEAVQKRMECRSVLILGVFLLSVSILLEDSLLISHIQIYFTDMLSVTERNFSENILWLFIMLYSTVYCMRELERSGTAKSPGVTERFETVSARTADRSGIVKSPGLANPAEMMKFPGPAVSRQSPAQPDYLTEIAEKFKFTPREIQILHGILCDKTTAEICGELNISIGTVKTHTHNIYMKVQVKSRQELIRALAEHR